MKSLILVVVMVAGIAVFSMAMTIGFVISTLNNPYFVAFANYAKVEAQTLGVNLIMMNANNSNSKEFEQVEDLIQRKVDALIIDPTESNAVVSSVEAANKAGIPVVIVDRRSNGGEYINSFGTNNTKYGELEAEAAVKLLNGKGNVVIITGIPGSSAADSRTKGIMDILSKYPDIKIVASQTAQFDMATAMSVMESILVAHPNTNAVIAENDDMALGVIQAIKTAGKTAGMNGIIVIGGDGIPQGLQAVKDGTEAADVEMSARQGEMGVIAAYFYLHGWTILPKVTILPVSTVTKANVDYWLARREDKY